MNPETREGKTNMSTETTNQTNVQTTEKAKRTRTERKTYAAIIAGAGDSAKFLTALPDGLGIQVTIPGNTPVPAIMGCLSYLSANNLQDLTQSGVWRHIGGKSDPQKAGRNTMSDEELIKRFNADVKALQACAKLDGFASILRLGSNKSSLTSIAASYRRVAKENNNVVTLGTLNTEIQRVKRESK